MAILFDIGFRVDSKSLTSELQTISKEIQNAFSLSSHSSLSADMKEAIRQAGILESALKKATTSKGISFVSLNQELAKAGTSADQLIATLAKGGSTFAGSFNIALQSLASANREVIALSSKISEMKRVMTQSMKFTFAQEFQRQVIGAIQEAIYWTKELNTELTNISVVSGKSGQDLEKVYNTIIEKSRELRVSAQEYAEASEIFYQQGLNDTEVARRSEITIKAARAAGSATEEMSSQLTAVWNTYQMQGEEQERAAAVGARLAADTAVDFADIAEAMQISATAASQMGVSYDSLAAIIATVGDTTQQSASVIGNAYKTIFSRFYNLISSEEGAVELGRISTQLKELGINILDLEGNLIPLDTIIQDIGNRWDTYSQKQQIAISEVVGGTRQFGQFLALMQNFDKYQKLLASAQSETGTSLNQQYEANLNSIESAAENAAEAWSIAFSDIFDPDVIKGLYNGLEEVGEQVGNIIDSFGGLKGIITITGAYLIRYIVSALQQASVLARQMYYNIIPDGQSKQVRRETETMRTQVTQSAAERRSTILSNERMNADAKVSALRNVNIDTAAEQQKLNIYEKVALQMQQVNKLLNSNNELERIHGQHLKAQLEMYQQSANAAQDTLAALQKEVEQNKKKLELQRQIAAARQQEAAASPSTQQEISLQRNNLNNLISQRTQVGEQLQANQVNREANTSALNSIQNQLQTIQTSSIAGVDRSAEIQKLEQQKAALLEVKAALDSEQQELNQTASQLDKDIAKRQALIERLEIQARSQRAAEKESAKQSEAQAEIGSTLEDVIEILGNQNKEYKNSEEQIDDFTQKMGELRDEVQNFSGNSTIIDQMNDSINNISADNLTATLQDITNILNTPGAGDLIPPETNTRIQQLIASLETLETTERGLTNTQNQLKAALSGLSMGGAQYAQTLAGLASNIGMAAMGFQNLWYSIEEGNIAGVITNLGMLVPTLTSIVGATQSVIKVTTSYMAVKRILNGLQTQENAQLTAGAIAQALNITITEGMTGADLKAAAAKKGVAIAGLEENAAISANTVVTGINAAAWWAHPVVLILGAIILGVVAAFALWNRHLKESAERARESADATKEQVESLQNLSSEIENNTSKVKENVEAWKEAMTTNGDVAATYDTMIESLESLNNSLEEAGANTEELQVLMRKGLTTGDFTEYYEKAAEIQQTLAEDTINALGRNNEAELRATRKELTADGEALSSTVYFSGDEKTQEIMETLSSFGAEEGDTYVTLGFNFEDPEKFRQQYEQLLEAKEKFEKTLSMDELESNTSYQRIIKMIDQASGSFEQLSANAEEAGNQIKTALSDEIEQVSQVIQNSNFENGRQAMNGLLYEVTQLGEAAGLTTAEIYDLLESIATADPNMASWMAIADQMAVAQNAITQNNDWLPSSTDYDNQLAQLEEQKNFDPGAVNIGTWMNGLSQYEEYQLDKLDEMNVEIAQAGGKGAREYVESFDKELRSEKAQEIIEEYYNGAVEAIKSEQQKMMEEQAKLGEFMNSITGEDKELFIKMNLEGVKDVEDIEEKLNALREVDLVVKIDYQAQLDDANLIQENLRSSMEEYAESGELSYDTVGELLALGPEYKRFIIETADGYKLTTEAIDKFNQSIKDEDEALSNILSAKTDFTEAFKELAYLGADLSAMPDYLQNIDIENIGSQISTLVQDFYNGKITMDQFFGTGTGDGLLGQIDLLGQEVSSLSLDQLKELTPLIEGISEAMQGYIDSVQSSYSAGEIDGGQMVNYLSNVTTAVQDLDNVSLETLKKQLSETGKAFSDFEKNADGTLKVTEDLTEEQEPLVDSYNDLVTAAKNLDKAVGKMEIGETILDTTSDYYDELQKIFDENDLSLEIPVEDLDFTWMDEMNNEIVTKLQSLNTTTKAELSTLVTNAATELGRLGTIPQNLVPIVQQVATQMATTGQDFTTALNEIGGDFALSEEQVIAVHTGVTQTLVQTGNTAVNEGMNATLDSMSQAETEMAKFSLKIKVSKIGFDWEKTTWTIFGKDFSFSLPKPYVQLDAEAGGALGTILNNASGADTAPEIPNVPWEPITGLGGSLPTKDDLEVGNPDLISDEDGNTDLPDGDSGGGGSGDKFEPEEKLDNEDAEKFHERYENLTEELERMTEQLEDYEKAADDAFGVAKYRALQNYEKQLAKIGTRQKALIKETQDYYKKDKNDFLSLSPEIATLARWSDTGEFATLQNPEQIRLYLEQQAQLALETYNNAVDAYNMAGDSSDAAKAQLDNAKTIYDDTIAMLQKQNDALDQLLETEDLMRERINEQVENIREWMSTKVEKYTYAMELQISINDLDVEWMDHLIEQWGDLGIKTGKTWDWLKNNIASAGSNLDATIKNMGQMQTILDNMGSGEYDDEFIAAFGEEAYQEYLDGNGRIPAEVIEQMESNASDMIGYLDDMYSSAEEMLSQYIEILELYMDEFDKIATKLEQQNDRLDMYQELLEFSGQQYGESGRRARQQIADARVDTAATEVYRAQAQLDVAKTAAEQTRQQLQDFYDQYGTDTSAYSTAEAFTYNHLKEAMDTAEETLDDAQSTMTSSIQDLASAASEAIESMAQVIKEEVVENLGGDFADFESMTEMYDQQYELDHFFLEDYDKNYQLNKLLGQVEDSMADITDPNRLKEYQSLIDDINGSLQDGVDITQTDVDLLNARFELQQAMDAYEEAQAQKNTMRLARDASGNWSYVYSQDQTQQDDAAQRLADAQYNYEKLLHEARDESEQLWIQMQQEFFEFQESIDWARMQFDQKYRDQIYQQYDYYQRMTENYTGQVIKYNDMLDANFSETTLGIITNYTNMESAQGAYTEQHKIYHAELESNTQHYQTVVSGVCNDVGIDYNDLATAIDEETSDIMDSNDELKGNIDTLREEAIDDLTAINDKLGPWSRDFIDYMNNAEDSVRSLIQALQDLRREQLAEIEKEQATEDFGPEVEEPTEGVTQAPVETPAEDSSTQKAAAAYENAMEIYHKINRGLYPTGSANRRQQAISEGYTATEYEIAQDLINRVYPVSKRGQGIAWDTAVAQIKAKYFATGGLADYTGPAWVDGSYSKPELVLNADDTKNILSAVSQMREVVRMKMQNMNGNLGRQADGVASKTVVNKDIQQVEQSVQIEASFPNVSVAAEIEEALNNLINQVAQYNIKK